jgi:predicted esterase
MLPYHSRMSTEHHLEVPRTARYYLNGSLSAAITDVWFVCHGYGQLASDFIREFDVIASPGRLIVAPEAMSRFYLSDGTGFHGPDSKVGATWMTREDRDAEIADYVAYLERLYDEIFRVVPREAAKFTVLGFSQGGATATRWLTRGKSRADRLLLWGSFLPADYELSQGAAFFRDVPLSIVYGKRDRYADAAMIEKYERQLAEHGIPHRLFSFDGGHRMDRETLTRLAAE